MKLTMNAVRAVAFARASPVYRAANTQTNRLSALRMMSAAAPGPKVCFVFKEVAD